jgi:hypothetical protein
MMYADESMVVATMAKFDQKARALKKEHPKWNPASVRKRLKKAVTYAPTSLDAAFSREKIVASWNKVGIFATPTGGIRIDPSIMLKRLDAARTLSASDFKILLAVAEKARTKVRDECLSEITMAQMDELGLDQLERFTLAIPKGTKHPDDKVCVFLSLPALIVSPPTNDFHIISQNKVIYHRRTIITSSYDPDLHARQMAERAADAQATKDAAKKAKADARQTKQDAKAASRKQAMSLKKAKTAESKRRKAANKALVNVARKLASKKDKAWAAAAFTSLMQSSSHPFGVAANDVPAPVVDPDNSFSDDDEEEDWRCAACGLAGSVSIAHDLPGQWVGCSYCTQWWCSHCVENSQSSRTLADHERDCQAAVNSAKRSREEPANGGGPDPKRARR